MSRTIKGQAWINKEKTGSDENGNPIYTYSLVQDTITFDVGKETSAVEVIIEDIWEDLTSASGKYKFNSKKDYFYWEYKMTDISDDNLEVTVNFDCPRPIEGIFEEPYDPESVSGEYAKYWVEKLKTVSDNYENAAAIQRKEVVFPGTEAINYSTGEIETYEDIIFHNSDLGDVTNLLNLF